MFLFSSKLLIKMFFKRNFPQRDRSINTKGKSLSTNIKRDRNLIE